jgi:hypothetical protein
MSLEKIMSITGMSGLHKMVAQSTNGFIAESLTDKKRFPVAATQRVSMLTDITMFTKGGDIKLADVFRAMKKMSDADLNVDANADNTTLKNFFRKVVPDFDDERVYASDIRKVIKWYHLVKDMVTDEEKETGDKGQEAGEKGEVTGEKGQVTEASDKGLVKRGK